MTDNQECERCAFYVIENSPDGDDGRCHRTSPQTVQTTAMGLGGLHSGWLTVWPAVLPDEWCGEYVEHDKPR